MQSMDFEEFLWPKVRLLSDKIRVIEIISLKNIAERLTSCHVANYIPETGNAKLGTFQYCQFLDGQILAGMIKASLKAIWQFIAGVVGGAQSDGEFATESEGSNSVANYDSFYGQKIFWLKKKMVLVSFPVLENSER